MPPTGTSGAKQKGNGASWVSLGVDPGLAKSLALRGFKTPTPIQRATLPLTLATPSRDVLGMARTGSGKTLAYLIPLLLKLLPRSDTTRSPRALVLCPNRELALQILKAGKDLARGVRSIEGAVGWMLAIGGDAMERQFEAMMQRPDVIIATPGRFLHLAVEMDLDLRGIDLVVYDEADRLFEMGFEPQMREILLRLPSSRQSFLFSATLPASVAEFAKAGLRNPALIRLDGEQQLSPDLDLQFLYVNPFEKDAVLLVTLEHALSIPVQSVATVASPQAIIFASTKHHVEYLANLLEAAGYACSYAYGSLDQTARQTQLLAFRNHQTNLLVVTDVAARGLDIPVMEHVVNYDFPAGSRVFVHRVGRTARAGRKGAAWSFITKDDLPFLVDLESSLNLAPADSALVDAPRHLIDSKAEYIRGTLGETVGRLDAMRAVMLRGQKMFERTRPKASIHAYREAKARQTVLGGYESASKLCEAFPYFGNLHQDSQADRLINSLESFQPMETAFEVGRRGGSDNASLMRARRQLLDNRVTTPAESRGAAQARRSDQLRLVTSEAFRDPVFFLSHARSDQTINDAYSLSGGISFASGVQAATMNLALDEHRTSGPQKARQQRWGRNRKQPSPGATTSSGQGDGLIRTEDGSILPASFNSGRFQTWRKNPRLRMERWPESSMARPGASDSPVKRSLSHHRDPQAWKARREVSIKRK